MEEIKSIIGLFVPVKFDDKWGATISVSGIPLGIYMVAIAVVVNLIMK
jgi:hypothetical protein